MEKPNPFENPIPIYNTHGEDMMYLTGAGTKQNDLKRCKKGQHNYSNAGCLHCGKILIIK